MDEKPNLLVSAAQLRVSLERIDGGEYTGVRCELSDGAVTVEGRGVSRRKARALAYALEDLAQKLRETA